MRLEQHHYAVFKVELTEVKFAQEHEKLGLKSMPILVQLQQFWENQMVGQPAERTKVRSDSSKIRRLG